MPGVKSPWLVPNRKSTGVRLKLRDANGEGEWSSQEIRRMNVRILKFEAKYVSERERLYRRAKEGDIQAAALLWKHYRARVVPVNGGRGST